MSLRRILATVATSVALSLPSFGQDMTGFYICIDPGHGGYNSNDRHLIPDPGIDFYESESNFQKALHLKALFEAHGASVLLTRYSNSGTTYPDNTDDPDEPSLSARVATANANNVDWFHSIHSNATGGTNGGTNYTLMLVREQIVDGGSAIYGPGTGQPAWPEAWAISQIMGPMIVKYGRTSDARLRLDWTFYGGNNGGYTLGVLRGLLMPGELSEGSFHDFYPETRRLMNNARLRMEAYSLLASFRSYLQLPADTLGIVAGIVTDYETSKPINGVVVRLLPEDRVYNGDSYNNGFYMFDSIAPGPHMLRFETPAYYLDSVAVEVTTAPPQFVDRPFYGPIAAYVANSVPKNGSATVSVTASIGVVFSRPMDTATVRTAFSLTPSVPGSFSWTNLDKTILFKSTNPLPYSTEFTLTVDTTALNVVKMPLDATKLGHPNAFSISFRTVADPTGVEETPGLVPTEFTLRQNFPNPFNPSTTLQYDVPAEARVTLTVVDVTGREVARLVDGTRPAGRHTATFIADGLPSGVYLAILRSGLHRSTSKLMLLR